MKYTTVGLDPLVQKLVRKVTWSMIICVMLSDVYLHYLSWCDK